LMNLKGRDIMHARDFSKDECDYILDLTDYFYSHKRKELNRIATDRIIALLFFEPSTRTSFAFEAAIHHLGGGCLGESGVETTSYKKGESFTDGIRMVDKFCDLIVMRHPEQGAPQKAAEVADVPVINCGDGNNQHPTQPLLELYAIKKLKGDVSGLNVVLMGDLKHMRVDHSIAYTLAMYGNHVIYVSPPELTMPEEITDELRTRYNAKISVMDPPEALEIADVVYITPIAKRRFEDPKEYEKFASLGTYQINRKVLQRAKKDLLVLAPLPRYEELSTEIDNTPCQGYFKMYEYAVSSKMAILSAVLGLDIP
jgi:aspartate carbamoyltransferase catalytic subunit